MYNIEISDQYSNIGPILNIAPILQYWLNAHMRKCEPIIWMTINFLGATDRLTSITSLALPLAERTAIWREEIRTNARRNFNLEVPPIWREEIPTQSRRGFEPHCHFLLSFFPFLFFARCLHNPMAIAHQSTHHLMLHIQENMMISFLRTLCGPATQAHSACHVAIFGNTKTLGSLRLDSKIWREPAPSPICIA